MKHHVRKTAISFVEPDRILLRGYEIGELLGWVSWGAAVFLVVTGELPNQRVGLLMDAILTSLIDHGPRPASTIAACTVASTGASLNSSVAAGILGIAKYHGGAIEDCMTVLERCVNLKTEPLAAASEVAREYRLGKRRVPGFGHREHSKDPRTSRLFELAHELDMSSQYVEHAKAMETVLSDFAGRTIPLNADGAVAALLCEMEFPKAAANGIFLVARVPGLIAHCLEEQARNPPLRPIDPDAYEYDGPAARRLGTPKVPRGAQK
jgi:citryl-CoA lyase